jgi:integrase
VLGQYDVRPAFIYDEPVSLEQQSIAYEVIDPAQYGVHFTGTVYFTRRDVLEAKRPLAQALVTTTTERIETHLFPAFEDAELGDLTRDRLQRFLDDKVRDGLSRSVVSHLRWDLNAVFKMAGEDTIVQGNPAGSLVTPKGAKTPAKLSMSKDEVRLALSVLDLRDRIVFLLAVLVGMRPGEIFALRWGKVDSEMIDVAERVYRGLSDDPKTDRGKRLAALPPDLSISISGWRELSADTSPDALVFPSERGTFLSYNFLRRNIKKKLEKVGLGWVNFQVLRRTQASRVDPKVAADQRGHAIGVAIDTYTESDQESRREAVTKLEFAFGNRMPANADVKADPANKQGFQGKRGKKG